MITRVLFLSVAWLILSFLGVLIGGTRLRRVGLPLTMAWLFAVVAVGDLWAYLTFGVPREILALSVIAFVLGMLAYHALPDWNAFGQVGLMVTVLATVIFLAYTFLVVAFTPLGVLSYLLAMGFFFVEAIALLLALSHAYESFDVAARVRWRRRPAALPALQAPVEGEVYTSQGDVFQSDEAQPSRDPGREWEARLRGLAQGPAQGWQGRNENSGEAPAPDRAQGLDEGPGQGWAEAPAGDAGPEAAWGSGEPRSEPPPQDQGPVPWQGTPEASGESWGSGPGEGWGEGARAGTDEAGAEGHPQDPYEGVIRGPRGDWSEGRAEGAAWAEDEAPGGDLDARPDMGWAGAPAPQLLGAPDEPRFPMVSFHVPAYSEPPEMLAQTLDHLAALDYPNYEVLVVDNNTPEAETWESVKEMCDRLGPRFRFLHLDRWPGFKSGALNFALTQTDPEAEIIAVLDADYHVAPEFLRETVGAFADPQLAFLQTPQDYRDFAGSRFGETIYDSYRYFFEVSMPARNEDNAIIFCGTMGLIRKSVLQEIGGWDEWCITEDAEASLRILKRGYTSLYFNRTYGRGLLPLEFEGMKKQRFRWCFGGIQILRKHWESLMPWAHLVDPDNHLTAAQRYFYLVGGLQWYTDLLNLVFVLYLVLGGLYGLIFHGSLIQPLTGPLIVIPAVYLVLNVWRFAWLLHAALQLPWRRALASMYSFFAVGWVVALADLQGLRRAEGVFLRTPKSGSSSKVLHALRVTWWEGVIGGVCLAVGAGLLFLQRPHAQTVFLAGLLGWQSSLYLSAPVLSLLSAFGARAAAPVARPMREPGRPMLESKLGQIALASCALAALLIGFAQLLPRPSQPAYSAYRPPDIPVQALVPGAATATPTPAPVAQVAATPTPTVAPLFPPPTPRIALPLPGLPSAPAASPTATPRRAAPTATPRPGAPAATATPRPGAPAPTAPPLIPPIDLPPLPGLPTLAPGVPVQPPSLPPVQLPPGIFPTAAPGAQPPQIGPIQLPSLPPIQLPSLPTLRSPEITIPGHPEITLPGIPPFSLPTNPPITFPGFPSLTWPASDPITIPIFGPAPTATPAP